MVKNSRLLDELGCDELVELGHRVRFWMSTLELPVVASEYDGEGRFLCEVSVALNRQRIGVQNTDPGAALNENVLLLEESGLRVNAVRWGLLESGGVRCVFLGLNNGEVWIYSPAANAVVYRLSTGNSSQVNDVVVKGDRLWCVDAQDWIYEFSLADFALKQRFQVETCVSLGRLCLVDGAPDRLLVASHCIFLVDVAARKVIQTYPGHTTPVTHLAVLTSEYFVTGASSDRFLNVYDLNTGATKTVLVLQSNLQQFSHSGEHAIAVTTEDGDIEIFADPLVANVASNKRRGNKSKQSSKTIHGSFELNGNVSKKAFLNVSINRDIINLVWLHNATVPNFVQLKWQDLPIDHTVELANKTIPGEANRSLYGTELAAVTNYKEANARITHGDNFKHVNEVIKEWETDLAQQEREDDGKGTESLADKLELTSLGATKRKASPATTAGTVTVILSQALQSNDHSLLETVLNNRDERVIRDTIFRLKPPLAVSLLERLAERIARQTNRQGPLNVWVKWCLIIHGGYLVAIPNLMSSLSSLHSALKRRSALLPRLLTLEVILESTLNRIYPTQDIDDVILASSEIPPDSQEEAGEEDEEDVEYNEELDDAGLIEDGEEDYEESSEEESLDELADGPRDAKSTQDLELSDEEEAGYSDVEMS